MRVKIVFLIVSLFAFSVSGFSQGKYTYKLDNGGNIVVNESHRGRQKDDSTIYRVIREPTTGAILDTAWVNVRTKNVYVIRHSKAGRFRREYIELVDAEPVTGSTTNQPAVVKRE